MPTGTLPNAGSLGGPQITTGDYQTQINQLLAYVRSLQAEVATLSGTTIREGAVRGVGNGVGLLADKAVLDARLGTSGNLGTAALLSQGNAGATLGSMASQETTSYLSKAQFDPTDPLLVWSGNSQSVLYSSLNNPRGKDGIYLVRVYCGPNGPNFISTLALTGSLDSMGTTAYDFAGANKHYWVSAWYDTSQGSFRVRFNAFRGDTGQLVSGSDLGWSGINITAIWKL